jgi:hypothetical protein
MGLGCGACCFPFSVILCSAGTCLAPLVSPGLEVVQLDSYDWVTARFG